MTDLGSPRPPQMPPKSRQKVIKNRCEKRSEQRIEIRPSWGRLGTILGRFGSPLGLKNVDFSLVFKGFRENSLFSKNIASRAVLGPTWHDLGRFWLPFWHPFGTQDGQKTMLKNIKKKKRKKSENGRPACQKPEQLKTESDG